MSHELRTPMNAVIGITEMLMEEVEDSGNRQALEPLERIIDGGRTPAEEMLEKFHGPWQGSVEPAYDEYAF